MAASVAHAERKPTLPEQVRAANGRFEDVAVAVKEGYALIPQCERRRWRCDGRPYVNAKPIGDDKVEIARPEAVMRNVTSADGRI